MAKKIRVNEKHKKRLLQDIEKLSPADKALQRRYDSLKNRKP